MMRQRNYRDWSFEDNEFLKAHAAEHSLEELHQRFDRTIAALRKKLLKMGLHHRYEKALWTKQELGRVIVLAETHTRYEIAAELGRTPLAVKDCLRKLGVRLFSGRYSLSGIERATGYTKDQITRAKKALGQEWQKAKWCKIPRYLATETQMDACIEYLKTEPCPKGRDAFGRYARAA